MLKRAKVEAFIFAILLRVADYFESARLFKPQYFKRVLKFGFIS